jgi:tetratricopeptide (TPR) repeat protein
VNVEHLTPESLRAYLEDCNTPAQSSLLLHHLAVCPDCYAVGGHVLDLFTAGAVGPELCLVDLEIALSRAEAPRLWEELRSRAFADQQEILQTDPAYKSWGLAELLCRESVNAAASDPARAVELAKLAVMVSSLLEEGGADGDLQELRALTWATLGNARRVQGDLRNAASDFKRADSWWEEGVADAGDGLGYKARFLDLKASFMRAQRRLPQARALLDRALDADRGQALKGRLLINKARVLEEMGDLDRAILLLQEAAPFIDPDREPRLSLCQRQNLVDYLSKAGRHDEAERLLQDVRVLASQVGGELDRIRLRWTEGRIAAGLGRLLDAALALTDVRRKFVERGIGYDGALVSLELATVYAELGDNEAVKDLARESLPLFVAEDVPREALAAVAVFVVAAEADVATAELLRRLTAYVAATRHAPASQVDDVAAEPDPMTEARA